MASFVPSPDVAAVCSVHARPCAPSKESTKTTNSWVPFSDRS
jgi:hypothetical protein